MEITIISTLGKHQIQHGNDSDILVTGYINIKYFADDTGYETYNIYVLGDCWAIDDGINISDVVQLRQAIVKNSQVLSSSDFYAEASDVNGSNIDDDGTRNIGDVGDVILIRQRILNYKWTN